MNKQIIIFILILLPFSMKNFHKIKISWFNKTALAQTLDEGGGIPEPNQQPNPSVPNQEFPPDQSPNNQMLPVDSPPTDDMENKKSFANAYPEDITDENFPDLVDSFDFKNADIGVVIEAISKLTQRNFIIDSQNIRGKITIIAPSRITVAEAYKAFLSALAVNNLTVVPSGKFLKIKPARSAQKDGEIFLGNYVPDTDQMITRLIQLKHTRVSDVNQFLRGMITQHGLLQPHEPTNTLVVTDFGSNVTRLMKIIEQIDKSSVNEQLAVIPIQFAKAKDIASLLEKIINKGQTPSKGRPNIPRFRRTGKAAQKKGSAFSLVLPDERTNSIIVLGNQQGIAEIRRLIRQLDIRVHDEGGLYVYYVKHGKAEDIANTINGITQQQRKGENTKRPAPRPTLRPGGAPAPPAASGSAGLLGGDIKITSNEDTNSLIIAASRQDYGVILNLLSKIDIPRDQVFVEAIILEMRVEDTLTFGFSILGFQPNTDGKGRAGFVGPNTLKNILDIGTTGLALGFAFGQDVTINPTPLSGNTSNINVKSVMGFVNFLKQITKVNVLSTPQILALDNAEAEIEVGQRVSVGQSSTVSVGNPIISNPQYEDASIKLKIIPQISSDQETIRLEIEQSIDDVIAVEGGPPNFSTRSLKSDVVVRNGDTIVIGGLMKDGEAPIIHKIPILGDIPILGWLFKTKSVLIEKLNLLVFLTPRIIKTQADARRLSDFKLKERLQFVKDTGGEDFHGRKVEEIRIANAKKHTATEDLSEDNMEDLQENSIEDLRDDSESIEEGIQELESEDIEL